MELQLTVVASGGIVPVGTRVRFGEDGGSIGRARSNDLVLDDPTVSRCHAEVRFEDYCFFLTDTSSGGVLVNDAPVGRGDRVLLRHADEVRIGGFRLHVDLEDARVDKTMSVSSDISAAAALLRAQDKLDKEHEKAWAPPLHDGGDTREEDVPGAASPPGRGTADDEDPAPPPPGPEDDGEEEEDAADGFADHAQGAEPDDEATGIRGIPGAGHRMAGRGRSVDQAQPAPRRKTPVPGAAVRPDPVRAPGGPGARRRRGRLRRRRAPGGVRLRLLRHGRP